MTDYVIDTNVWVVVDKISDIKKLSKTEIDCIETCRNWLRDFANSNDKLVIDGVLTRKILNEYRKNIGQRGRARDLLNQLERLPRERLIEIDIKFDSDGYAIVPPEVAIQDKNDRKFIAVALAHEPTPPIVDATDTDWAKEDKKLLEYGLIIHELCPDFIRQKLTR